jgi:hypothetical protein
LGLWGDIEDLNYMRSFALLAKAWKQSRLPLLVEWKNKLLYFHEMEDFSAIKRNDLHVTT